MARLGNYNVGGGQIGLLLFTVSLIFGGIYLAYIDVTLWVVYPILIFGFYTSFTTLHDATHRTLSSNKYLMVRW